MWGGDNIYADTHNMKRLRAMYDAQNQDKGYQELKKKAVVIGTWDDRDYGLNDGRVEFTAKKISQQDFLNFMDVPKDSPRRIQEDVYAYHKFDCPKALSKLSF